MQKFSQILTNKISMHPVKKRRRLPHYTFKPFPDEKVEGIFTGLDVEIFNKNSMKYLNESGCYGFNSKPRQTIAFYDKQPIVKVSQEEYQRKLEWKEKFNAEESGKMISVDEQLVADPFDIPKSLILFPEEAFFLIHNVKCLEIKDLDENEVTAEKLWKFYCEVKYDFVDCYVAYLYLKSKNWVIKCGTKFGGNFCKLNFIYWISNIFFSGSQILYIFSALQTQSTILPCNIRCTSC